VSGGRIREAGAGLVDVLHRFPPEDESHACAGSDPDEFFLPEGLRGPQREAVEAAAVATCAGCGFVADCLQYALLLGADYGVFGGMTPEQRASYKRRQKRRARASTAPTEKETTMPRPDLRECTKCGDDVEHLSKRLWCNACETGAEDVPAAAIAPAPEPTSVDTPDDDAERLEHDDAAEPLPAPVARVLPDYALQLVSLLGETEGHADPLVRATRKIVTQAAVALDQALKASQSTTPVRPRAAQPSGTRRSNGAGAQSAAARIRDLGTTPAAIRTWAAQNDVPCSPTGIVPARVVDAYAASLPDAAA
jgi:WhiB family redox-sensing transcriptional regulator